MTLEEANALEEWIKDHDTRYLAKAKTDADRCYVLLTRPEDGTELDPVYDIEEYYCCNEVGSVRMTSAGS